MPCTLHTARGGLQRPWTGSSLEGGQGQPHHSSRSRQQPTQGLGQPTRQGSGPRTLRPPTYTHLLAPPLPLATATAMGTHPQVRRVHTAMGTHPHVRRLHTAMGTHPQVRRVHTAMGTHP